MSIHDPFTPAERRLAVLLFCLALLGQLVRLGPRLSPEVAAWLEDHEVTAPAESLRYRPETSLPAAEAPPGDLGPVASESVRGDAAPIGTSGPDPALGGFQVDVNRAGLEALVALPGVGPVLARRILEDRERNGPYRQPEDLLRVPGIGPATLARLRPHLRVEAAPGRLN